MKEQIIIDQTVTKHATHLAVQNVMSDFTNSIEGRDSHQERPISGRCTKRSVVLSFQYLQKKTIRIQDRYKV